MSPSIASTSSSRFPQDGRPGCGEDRQTPWCGCSAAALASVRRLGQPGAVVEVVEGVDEVAVRAGRQVGSGQSGHVTSTPCSRLVSGCAPGRVSVHSDSAVKFCQRPSTGVPADRRSWCPHHRIPLRDHAQRNRHEHHDHTHQHHSPRPRDGPRRSLLRRRRVRLRADRRPGRLDQAGRFAAAVPDLAAGCRAPGRARGAGQRERAERADARRWPQGHDTTEHPPGSFHADTQCRHEGHPTRGLDTCTSTAPSGTHSAARPGGSQKFPDLRA